MGVVQTAYRFDLQPQAWLGELCGALEPLLGVGEGLLAFQYRLHGGRIQVVASASSGFARWRRALMLAGTCAAPTELPGSAEGSGLSSVLRGIAEALSRVHAPSDAGCATACTDAARLGGANPSGVGVLVNATRRRAAQLSGDSMSRRWGQVAAHLAVAVRLRESLADASHDEASEALRVAARRVDCAHANRVDADAALEMWQGLVDGTWSLVECFEADGRRFVIARRNEDVARDPRALSPRQRQVAALAAATENDPLIAGKLGISESSVRTHLRRGLERLGLRDRRELIRFVRLSANSGSPSP